MLRSLVFFCFALSIATVSNDKVQGDENSSPAYSEHVAPILRKHCSGCHNRGDAESGLALDTFASLKKGGKGGSGFVAGNSRESRILKVVRGEIEPKMPPEGTDPPSEEQLGVIARWIDQGAIGPAIDLAVPSLDEIQRVPLKIEPKASIQSMAISPDESVVAVAQFDFVHLYSLPGLDRIATLTGHDGPVTEVAFSPDGKRIVAAAGVPGISGQAVVWDVETQARLMNLDGKHSDALLTVQYSADSKLIATGGYDQTIVVWDAISGQALRTLEGHNGPVFSVDFHPNRPILASASGDRTVKLWNAESGARLDTLSQATKELLCVRFHPGGETLAAGGVDNRIRVWRLGPDVAEGTNVLLISEFAHEGAILRLSYSRDGKRLVSSADDFGVKFWQGDRIAPLGTLPRQSDWATGLALSASGSFVVIGRQDGTFGRIPWREETESSEATAPAPESPATVDYGPQPSAGDLPIDREQEPNDSRERATTIATPGRASGVIGGKFVGPADTDLYSFEAREGDQWVIEVEAAQKGSQLDSRIEVLDESGKIVPKLILRAVRDTEIEFRPMNSEQRGARLKNWEEMFLNEYVYLNGEVIKLFRQRQGPDADANFYPEDGARRTYFGTTAQSHALFEPGYMVVPYPVGTKLPDNGLPVIPIGFENDDDPDRKLGRDSTLTFVAPKTGKYYVRVSDVRGKESGQFFYTLVVRRPQADFQVSLLNPPATLERGSGKILTFLANRVDHFVGPISLDVENLPHGYSLQTPLEIAAGLDRGHGAIYASDSAEEVSPERWAQVRITASADRFRDGRSVSRLVTGLAPIKLQPRPKVQVYLEVADANASQIGSDFPPSPAVVSLRAGGSVTCKLRVTRDGFEDRISLDVLNLPHGVIVDDIGLNGVLLPEGQTERTIFLRAEPWVKSQTRPFMAVAQVEGNQASPPLLLQMLPKEDDPTRQSLVGGATK